MSARKIWDTLREVPKEAVKPVPGGSKLSSIDPMWRAQRLTEVFGPIGVGWGFEMIGTPWTITVESDTAVFVTCRGWFLEGDQVRYCGPATGGTMLTKYTRNDDLMPFDDAVKAAETDAWTKSFSLLGLGANVYMGIHDGDKYQRPEGQTAGAYKKQNQTSRPSPPPASPPPPQQRQQQSKPVYTGWRNFTWPYGKEDPKLTMGQLHEEGKLLAKIDWIEKSDKSKFTNKEMLSQVENAIGEYYDEMERSRNNSNNEEVPF